MRKSELTAVNVFLGLFGLLACMAAPGAAAAQGGGSVVGVDIVHFDRNGDADPVGRGERITVRLVLSDVVTVSGSPRLALRFGGVTRLALYTGLVGRTEEVESGRVKSYLSFLYDVQPSDVAADGVALAPDALRLHGGSIRDSERRDVNLDLGAAASARSTFGVDGGVDNPPAVESIRLNPPGRWFVSRDTFELREPLSVNVSFTEFVAVTGNPSLGLTIGTRVRQAGYLSKSSGEDGTSRLYFVYYVDPSDLDTDGLSIDADALALNGGSIRDGGGTSAALGLLGHVVSNDARYKVDGRTDSAPLLRPFVPSPAGAAYGAGERMRISVQASEPVTVTGEPTLAVSIGDRVRQAEMWHVSHVSSFSTLNFRYDVQASDRDEDGLSIAADALALNGGSIRDAAGSDADLNFGSRAVTDSHRVDGRTEVPFVAKRMGLPTAPKVGDAYRLGEEIIAYVSFPVPVTVIGAPGLALTIGDRTRQMAYDGIYPSGVSLRFRYTVQASDRDEDGIEIGPNALTLNGGAIRDSRGRDANLSLADTWHRAWVHYKVK